MLLLPDKSRIKTEFLAGITVALALVPEALSFSLIAGVPPVSGLFSAFIVGLVTSLLGGRPGMISGATAAVSIGLISLNQQYGVEYLFAAVILGGIFQIVFGMLKLGKLIRLVSQPVMSGFVNGLAVLILLSQLVQFKQLSNGHLEWLAPADLITMLGLVSLTVLIVLVFPKVSKAFPGSLAAIIFTFIFVSVSGIQTISIGDIAHIQSGVPSLHPPEVPLSIKTFLIILPYSLIMAAVGLTESLLTLNLISELTKSEGSPNKDSVFQGVANILSGLFSGIGGCAMVGQSLLNYSAGGRERFSGVVAAVILLVFILFASTLVEKIPVASLTGIMIVIALRTFKWESFKMIIRSPWDQSFIMLTVSVVTVVYHNLALAVVLGVGLSLFAKLCRRLFLKKILNE